MLTAAMLKHLWQNQLPKVEILKIVSCNEIAACSTSYHSDGVAGSLRAWDKVSFGKGNLGPRRQRSRSGIPSHRSSSRHSHRPTWSFAKMPKWLPGVGGRWTDKQTARTSMKQRAFDFCHSPFRSTGKTW